MKNLFRQVKKTILFLVPKQIKLFYLSRVVRQYNELSVGEKEFFLLIKNFVNTVVDVGARTDVFYANSLLDSKVSKKVYMFEANPLFAAKLRDLAPSIDVNSFVFNFAIGKEPGALFYFYDTQSFVRKSRVGNVSKYKSKTPITVRTIDSFSETIKDIDFLKTDIEEMDFYALLGAKLTLPDVHFIQFELGLGMPYLDRTVKNSDYWSLLEPNFYLFVLKDENPIWKSYPKLPLLLELSVQEKIVIEILQQIGYGFNIVGINKKKGIPQIMQEHIGSINSLKIHHSL